MSISANSPPKQSNLVRLLVIGSAGWGLLVIVIAFLLSSGIFLWLIGISAFPRPDILVGTSHGHMLMAGAVVLIHVLALFALRTVSWGLVLAAGAMLFVSVVTGFTTGLWLLPCVLLLLVALLAKHLINQRVD